MSNKTVQLKDREGNNLYPKTPISNVIGLAPGLDNRHIYFGSGAPSNVKSSYEDIQVNDLYIDTSTSTRDGIFYRVSSFYTADVPKISWEVYGYYFMKSGTPPTTGLDWSMAFGGATSPYPRKGLLWCDTDTGHIYEFIGAPNDLQWRCLTDNYSKSELDTMIAAFQPDIDEKADRIEDSRQGSAITLEDSAEIYIPEITLFGKSVQNGTPSIDSPVAIEDVSSENILVKKKNLLTLTELNRDDISKSRITYLYNTTTNEFEMTCNNDGNILLGNVYSLDTTLTNNKFNGVIKIPVEQGQIITVTSKNGVFGRFPLNVLDSNKKVIYYNMNDGLSTVTLTIPQNGKWLVICANVLNATSGTTYKDNILVTADGSTIWENPTTPQTAELNLTLRGIPVSSGGNYTDNNGQEWICDTIERYTDGSGKLIQRVGKYTLNGSESWYLHNTGRLYADITNVQNPFWTGVGYLICSHLVNRGTTLDGEYIYNGSSGVYLNKNTHYQTVEELKTFLQTNNMTVEICLKVYTETPLTAEELAQLDLSTYYPITNITSNPDIKITYVADTKNYFDKKLEQIQNAIISNGGNV